MTVPPPPKPAPPPHRSVLGVGLVAFAVFITELALMRAVAQVTWPPFAFIALSAAMLGGGAAGTLFAVRPTWAHHPRAPVSGALIVALCAPAALLFALTAGLEPLRVGVDVRSTITFAAALVVFALPFAGLGGTLAAFLETHPHAAKRVYGADLIGGSAGAFLSIPLIDHLGPLGATFAASAIAGAGTVLLSRGRKTGIAGAALAAGGVTLALVQVAIIPNATVDKKIGERPATEVLQQLADNHALVTADRADARVDVVPARPAPRVLIDLGAAVTRAPVFPSRRTAPQDHASAAFLAHPPSEVLVIGSGAGFEVARALAHGAAHVDAVEVLRGLADVLPDAKMGGAQRLYLDPRVSFHHAEARAFLERTPKKYSHIVAIHTITNAALAAGAMRLSEDFLFTQEAMQTYLRHLAPEGVLYFTRPRAQMSLLYALATDALIANGVGAADLNRHTLTFEAERDDAFFSGMLIFAAPTDTAAVPLPPKTVRADFSTYRGAFPTDDRPFFHRYADTAPSRPKTAAAAPARLRVETPELAERSVLIVGVLAFLAALAALVLPLWLNRRNQRSRVPVRALAVSGLLGLGFMFAELSLAQRFTLICGRPLVAFGAVVGGMLLGAGALALLAQQRRTPLFRALVVAAAALGLSVALPAILLALGALTWPLLARVGLAALSAAVLAAPLGLPFPALIETLDPRRDVGAAAWLYAVNAVWAVLASALFAALAPHFGLMGMALVAAAIYALAAVFAPR